jgi:hypothetical protein
MKTFRTHQSPLSSCDAGRQGCACLPVKTSNRFGFLAQQALRLPYQEADP